MSGIVWLGSYLPYLRFSRHRWAQAWGLGEFADKMIGNRTVASFDEDSLTMATDAALCALGAGNPKDVDALFFASTTPPYLEKSNATVIANALDIAEEARTADFTGSLRASTQALLGALDAVKAGSVKKALVCVGDVRESEPRYYMETMMDDSGAAALVGNDDLLLELEASLSIQEEFIDTWRRSEDRYLRYDDERFSSLFGYLRVLPRAAELILKKAKIPIDQINKIVAYAPEGPTYIALAKRSGAGHLFNTDPLLMQVGNAGNCSVFLQLAKVLEDSSAGERILLMSYGEGADALIFKVTKKVDEFKKHNFVSTQLARAKEIDSYEKILYFRNAIKLNTQSIWTFEPYTSISQLHHDNKSIYGMYAQKCTNCGHITYPIMGICHNCQIQSGLEQIKLSRKGKVYSFVSDHVFPSPESPTIMAVVDLDSGGRVMFQLTDTEEVKVQVGQPVVQTFRKLHEAKGINHYWWKVRPVFEYEK